MDLLHSWDMPGKLVVRCEAGHARLLLVLSSYAVL
jgi:hypothetical protein